MPQAIKPKSHAEFILPVLTLLAFAARYLPKSYPPLEELRPLFNTTLLDNVASLVLAAILVLSAVGLGSFLLEKIRASGGAIQSVGLGLGAFSLVIFIAGNIAVNDYLFLLMLLVPQVLFAGRIRREVSDIATRAVQFLNENSYFAGFLLLAAGLVFVLNLVRAYFPPLDYDVLEYHLGAPARYWQEGRIRFLPENVYAAFPFNMEMLYLMAIGLKGELLAGAAFAQVINVVVGLLAAAAAGSLARKAAFTPISALIAAVAFYVFPWTSYLSTRAYVEPAMIFFAILCLSSVVDAVQLHEQRLVVLAGIFAGLSAGCKYPAVLFLTVPVAAFLVIIHLFGGSWKSGVRRAALFGVVSAATLSPWLIRNTVATGNPTYPLLHNVFGGRYWSDYQDAKWNPAHRPTEFTPRSFVKSTHAFLHEPKALYTGEGNERRESSSSLAWLPVAAAVVFLSRKDNLSLMLMLYVVCTLLLWYFFTHRIARFIAPWAMLAIIPATANAVRLLGRSRAVGYSAIGVSVVLMAAVSQQDIRLSQDLFNVQLLNAAGMVNQHELLAGITGGGSNFNYEAMQAINALPEDTKALLVGEAETFYVKRDFIMATVFDRNPMEDILREADDAAAVHRKLRELGVTHIYVNIAETERLRRTYSFDFEGHRVPGYLDIPEDNWSIMSEFFRRYCEIAQEFGKPIPLDDFREADRALFKALLGGRLVIDNDKRRCLPHGHVLYELNRSEPRAQY